MLHNLYIKSCEVKELEYYIYFTGEYDRQPKESTDQPILVTAPMPVLKPILCGMSMSLECNIHY